ncbi:uroporphyrinogen-III synthase [Falsirhodobacter sp. alg1]|uniref:uroporphyrinogen-III synthase n=1 Tax=Falsirhodobacter sp. alg1 TaxID=1472418 RepID=UPI0005EECCC6|nr:uroporphyrinogen-III synthase [Falsirhodobacter sp. alg1]
MFPQCRAPILLTRPAAQSAAFLRMLGDVPAVISPLTEPVVLSAHLPDAAAVIFTSGTAIAALGNVRPARRAWCVGDRTAELAREAGYEARSAAGNADDLVAAILASGDSGPLLHVRGRASHGNVAQRLSDAGCTTHEAVVYDMRPVPLSQAARDLLQQAGPVIVPLFSPAGAVRLAKELGAPLASLYLACLSGAVAQRAPAAAQTLIAARPDAAAMRDLVLAMRKA